MFMSSTHVCHGCVLPRQRASPSGLPAATIGLGDLRHAALMKAMVVQNKHPRTSGIKFDACAPVCSISRASGEFIILKHPSNLTTKISADTSNSHNKAVGLATPCRTGTDPLPERPMVPKVSRLLHVSMFHMFLMSAMATMIAPPPPDFTCFSCFPCRPPPYRLSRFHMFLMFAMLTPTLPSLHVPHVSHDSQGFLKYHRRAKEIEGATTQKIHGTKRLRRKK